MNLSANVSSTVRLTHVLVRAVACGLLLVLPSCAIPPLRPAEPGPPLPADFNGAASPDNSALLGVKEFFNDPTLASLIEQALAGNRELKILNEDVEIARSEALARQGGYFPLVGFRGSAGLDRHSEFTPLGAAEKNLEYLPGKHFPDPLPNFLLSLNFFMPVDLWRELRNARDAARLRYLSAAERRNSFVTRLVADVAEHYYRLMALDKRLETLDQTIQLQEQSLKLARARREAARGNELPVQRFLAEVRKNQSEKLIVKQEIVEAENRINFLANRFPRPVERNSAGFFALNIHRLGVGLPAQLLVYRPDIRQAERELEAAGLDVKVARARFFPKVDITGRIGYEAFSLKYLFWTPQAMVANLAADVTAPLINKKAIQAEYLSANARQLQTVYNYQRVILDAFTEVVNRLSMLENYSKSIALKTQQLQALEASVDVATKLFQNARVEYVEVLLALRDLMDARMVLIETKRQQLSAIVRAYQALGGGLFLSNHLPGHAPTPLPGKEAKEGCGEPGGAGGVVDAQRAGNRDGDRPEHRAGPGNSVLSSSGWSSLRDIGRVVNRRFE